MNKRKWLTKRLGHGVVIRWNDSAARGGWHPVDEEGPACIVSVGILVRFTDTSLVLAMWISTGGRCHEQITIPRGCITSMGVLTEEALKP